MTPVGFEPTISGGEGPKTYALDHAATGTGILYRYLIQTIMRKLILLLLSDKINSTYFRVPETKLISIPELKGLLK